jgi:hypothetical protein
MKKIVYICFVTIPAIIFSCALPTKNREQRSVAQVADKGALSKKTHLTEITTADQFSLLAAPATGVVRQGETIKVFIDASNFQNAKAYFMNANYCPQTKCAEAPQVAVSHFRFAQDILGLAKGLSESDYWDNSYRTTDVKDRKYYDARVQRFNILVDGEEKTYYGIRFLERDMINNEMVQLAMEAIMKGLAIPSQNLAFIVNSSKQKVDRIADWFPKNNVSQFSMETILSSVKYIGLNTGTAYGILRYIPQDESELEPFEIPVFKDLPLDLSVVAGTISIEFQDVGSHVNLKSKERNTPNMVLRDPKELEILRSFDGKPVKLTVGYESYKIEASTDDEVKKAYLAKTSGKWIGSTQVDTDKVQMFEKMCATISNSDCVKLSRSYGGKVAGMAFLSQVSVAGPTSALTKKFGYRLVPHGFGAPLSFYNKFMKLNSQKDPVLKDKLERLVKNEMGFTTPLLTAAEKKQLTLEIKNQILKGEIPKDVYDITYAMVMSLKSEVDTKYGISLNKLKIRSSSNAEDIVGFNGAGLHDSYSARINKSKVSDYNQQDCQFVRELDEDTGLDDEDISPKSLACAMKATYASLWNLRAVRERTYKRFDHRTASMGLSVQPSYKFKDDLKISSNSVLITRVVGTESVYGQQLSTQMENGLVTNPVPDTRSELSIMTFDVKGNQFGISLLQYAKPKAGQPALNSMILSDQKMAEMSFIARAVEIKYCEAKTLAVYYPTAKDCSFVVNSVKKSLALDMEFKNYSNGQILLKQVRTFSGR